MNKVVTPDRLPKSHGILDNFWLTIIVEEMSKKAKKCWKLSIVDKCWKMSNELTFIGKYRNYRQMLANIEEQSKYRQISMNIDKCWPLSANIGKYRQKSKYLQISINIEKYRHLLVNIHIYRQSTNIWTVLAVDKCG